MITQITTCHRLMTVSWCDRNYFSLDVNKSKEINVDFRAANRHVPHKAKTGAELTVMVRGYKYLEIIIDDNLKGSVKNELVYEI